MVQDELSGSKYKRYQRNRTSFQQVI